MPRTRTFSRLAEVTANHRVEPLFLPSTAKPRRPNLLQGGELWGTPRSIQLSKNVGHGTRGVYSEPSARSSSGRSGLFASGSTSIGACATGPSSTLQLTVSCAVVTWLRCGSAVSGQADVSAIAPLPFDKDQTAGPVRADGHRPERPCVHGWSAEAAQLATTSFEQNDYMGHMSSGSALDWFTSGWSAWSSGAVVRNALASAHQSVHHLRDNRQLARRPDPARARREHRSVFWALCRRCLGAVGAHWCLS